MWVCTLVIVAKIHRIFRWARWSGIFSYQEAQPRPCILDTVFRVLRAFSLVVVLGATVFCVRRLDVFILAIGLIFPTIGLILPTIDIVFFMIDIIFPPADLLSCVVGFGVGMIAIWGGFLGWGAVVSWSGICMSGRGVPWKEKEANRGMPVRFFRMVYINTSKIWFATRLLGLIMSTNSRYFIHSSSLFVLKW